MKPPGLLASVFAATLVAASPTAQADVDLMTAWDAAHQQDPSLAAARAELDAGTGAQVARAARCRCPR